MLLRVVQIINALKKASIKEFSFAKFSLTLQVNRIIKPLNRRYFLRNKRYVLEDFMVLPMLRKGGYAALTKRVLPDL